MLAYQKLANFEPIMCSRLGVPRSLHFYFGAYLVTFHNKCTYFLAKRIRHLTILENFPCHTPTLFVWLRIWNAQKVSQQTQYIVLISNAKNYQFGQVLHIILYWKLILRLNNTYYNIQCSITMKILVKLKYCVTVQIYYNNIG